MATDYSRAELAARRLAWLSIARATQKANSERHDVLRAPLRRDFADMHEWERLASDAGLLLPRFDTALTTGGMKRWLRRLGIPTSAYLAWDGSRRMADFIARNPSWTMRAWAGLILEHRHLMAPAPLMATSPTPTGPGQGCEIEIGRQPTE